MNEELRSKTPTIDIYIKLAQYPTLARSIRARMREELFRRGIMNRDDFEKEVKEKAIESQIREGVYDPFGKEPASVWQERKAHIRDYQTDFYFGYYLPPDLFTQLVQEVLNDQPSPTHTQELSFNPEVAPWEMLFQQGQQYEAMPPPKRKEINHHLEEIKAVLIKGMISDQLPYIGVARKVFDIADLMRIYRRRIGRGKIGGKAAGMLLAWKTLQQQDPESGPDLSKYIHIPESYFIATEVIYEFRLENKLDYVMNQKYRSLEEIRDEYPKIVEAHLKGKFPDHIVDQFRDILEQIGTVPLIVRSSSLLEDNFGYSFAGKYQSYFLPNQRSPEENLEALQDAIRRIYASSLNPDAILYRQKNNLIDYDERMAVLLQTLRGQQYGRYFLPTIAGVGFSNNSFRWNPKIRREEGFLRMVWGIGTRAVDRVSNDYPRLVALSHPEIRPEKSAKAIRQYTQRFVDVIDLEENEFKSLPIGQVLEELQRHQYPSLRYIASVDKGDYIDDMPSMLASDAAQDLLLTFDYLTRDRKFIRLMRTTLSRLEKKYGRPVDVEFTVEIEDKYPYPDYHLYVLQCRPLSQRDESDNVKIPPDIPKENILFTSYELIPHGRAEGIRYVIFVDPEMYRRIPEQSVKLELGRAISRLNKKLEDTPFIMMGPGRWGSANLELGVRVTYADIYNTRVLIEIAVASEDGAPELSYGTHFYQDLVETGIHALPLHLQDPKSLFNWSFFRESENSLAELLPTDADLSDYLRVIDVPKVAAGRRLNILMDGTNDEAVGYLVSGSWQAETKEKGSVSNF